MQEDELTHARSYFSNGSIRGCALAPGKERRMFTPRCGDEGRTTRDETSLRVSDLRLSSSVVRRSRRVIHSASSANHIVPFPPRTWKRAPSANWPTFSMNMIEELREVCLDAVGGCCAAAAGKRLAGRSRLRMAIRMAREIGLRRAWAGMAGPFSGATGHRCQLSEKVGICAPSGWARHSMIYSTIGCSSGSVSCRATKGARPPNQASTSARRTCVGCSARMRRRQFDFMPASPPPAPGAAP